MADIKSWNLEYDAPQFLDFENLPNNDSAENYFDVDHERSKMSRYFDVNSSTSTCATASPSVDPSHFPVHEGPFIFNAGGGVAKSLACTSNNKLKRKNIPNMNYSLRETSARKKINNPDVASPVAKKIRSSVQGIVENLKRKSLRLQHLIPRASSSPKPESVNKKPVKRNNMAPSQIENKRPKPMKQARDEILPRRLNPVSSFSVTHDRDPYVKVDFKSMLRSNKTVMPVNKKAQRCTVTQPFNFTETRKRKHEQFIEPQTYISMAEQLNKFQEKRGTPNLNQKNNSTASWNSSTCYKVTKPCTPKLRTLTRHRPVTAISAEEKEIQEAEEMKKNQFKAHPIKREVFHFKALPLRQKKKPTVPNFHLPSESLLIPHSKPAEPEEKYKFIAQPMPKKVYRHVVGVMPKPRKSPTKPKTPPFALKTRVDKWIVNDLQREEKEKAEAAVKKPTILPHPDKNSFSQKPFDLKPTVPAPFSFFEKDLQRYAKKEERLEKEKEEAMKVQRFQARPLPSPSVIGVPEKKVIPSTKPIPFDLLIDYRGQLMSEKWQRQVEEELLKQKEAMTFKAQPSNVIHKTGFQPKKADAPLTEVLNICLNTERRAVEREQFDHILKEKEDRFQKIKMLQEIEKEKEERIKEKQLRADMIHWAQPIHNFPPVCVKPSSKASTVPLTPHFETDKRINRRLKEN